MSNVKKKSVLIVDDERTNISTLKTMLSSEYNIYASSDGEEAIDTAEEFIPDVILLDIIMPEMDGYEVITALKKSEKTRNIPVIFITGLDSTEAEEKGLTLGAADYITKPFHSAIVLMRVKNQINLIERFRIEHDLNDVLKLQSDLIAAKKLAEHNREIAEHSNRAKSEFLSRMSHEMLTPLNVIIGMMEVIMMQNIPENIELYINETNNASNDLHRLINDVLDLSGIEYGLLKLTNSMFEINTMFKDVLQAAGYKASKKQQEIISYIDPAIPVSLMGDEKHLKQVIENLLANAIKFTPEQGVINFESRVLHDRNNGSITLQITVSDNGIGISKEQQDKLFLIFEQVDGSNTREYGGIGIGLALSKRIIEMMGGKIWVESELDKGAKFYFTCNLQKAK